MEAYRAYLNKLVDRRVEVIRIRGERIKRQIVSKLTTNLEKLDREWLEQYAKGVGLDIACGEFPHGDAVGVDININTIGADYYIESGDELLFQQHGTLDFVITNYFDAFPNTIKVLHEWHRCLKPGGVVAIICRDANAYETKEGPLENKNRTSLYTVKTLPQYLYRAGFNHVSVTANLPTKALRGMAVK